MNINKLTSKGEDENGIDKENEKNTCVYWPFYVKKDCEILDFNEEYVQKLEKLVSQAFLDSVNCFILLTLAC